MNSETLDDFEEIKGHIFYYSDESACGCWGYCGHWAPSCRRCGEVWLDIVYMPECDAEEERENE